MFLSLRCKNNDDGTVKILSSTSDTKVFRWENEAFRYFGNSDEIYIHCDVLVCVGNAGTGCQRCSTNKRKRRSLSDLSGSVEVAGNTKEVGVRTPVIVLVDGRTGMFICLFRVGVYVVVQEVSLSYWS